MKINSKLETLHTITIHIKKEQIKKKTEEVHHHLIESNDLASK
jgi:hypothetical protein